MKNSPDHHLQAKSMLASTSMEDLHARRRVERGCACRASVSRHRQSTNARAERVMPAGFLCRSAPKVLVKVLLLAAATLKSP